MIIQEKVFVKNDKATFVCPKCKKTTVEDVSLLIQCDVAVRIKHGCTCGHVYDVLLERRKFYRKPVKLPGIFYLNPTDKQKRRMTVRDISRGGVKLQLDDPIQLSISDTISIEFRLDDKHKTLIKKEVIIRNSYGNQVYGAEFFSRDLKNPYDKAYDMAIGFYTYR